MCVRCEASFRSGADRAASFIDAIADVAFLQQTFMSASEYIKYWQQ